MNLPNEITIEVKQNHIDQGIRFNCYKCPVALAICDYFNIQHENKTREVVVGVTSIDIMNNGSYKSYDLDSKTNNFIIGFDDGRMVKPFSFTMKGR